MNNCKHKNIESNMCPLHCTDCGEVLDHIEKQPHEIAYDAGFSSGSEKRATEIMEDLMNIACTPAERGTMREELIDYAEEKKISCSFNI